FMVMTRGDKPRWIMETVTSIQYLGRPATFGNFMDITDRKLAEEALSQSEQLYRAVIQQAAETICIVDVKSKLIIESNPAFRKLLGYSEDDLRSVTLYDFIADEVPNINQNVEKIVGRGEHLLGERFWRRSDSSLVEMEVSANAIFYAGRQALCVVARDISDRKKAERERKFLTQRLMSVGEDERKRLARDLHDELGQMLTALRFVLDALDGSLTGDLEVQKQKCRQALSLVEHISNSVRTILFELRPSLLDDLGLVPTLEWYIAQFMGHRPSINVTFDALGIKRRFEREKEVVLFRVFQECLNNVVKHAGAENVQVSLTLSYPKIIFIIKDDGIGFDQGAQLSRSIDGGRGIGLLGMRERVDSIGGKFEVISNRGTGTTVRVELDDSREETDE
ncbi:MAG: PAS domain-containing sensor histidine kinase, partial [Deltaproteobacteria bacterium]